MRTARTHRLWGSFRPSLALAALLLTGCASLPELDWNPLIRIEHTPDGAVEIEALGPLIDIRNGPEGLSHALRPLYQHKANFGYPITDFLAPFGRSFATEDGTRWRFWPLIWSGKTTQTQNGTKWNGVFFPFVFAGNGPQKGDGYFAFWPLAGRTRGIFGIETYDFFLWPFFMRTRMDITEQSTSWTVLLLGGWTTGGPRDGSWRILPFYRHRLVRHVDGTLRTDQHTVLWPFFTWGMDYGDTKNQSYRRAFWPFIGYESAKTWSRTTVLWPFFRFNHETEEAGGDYLYDLPWPLVRLSKDPERKVTRFFPFYSHQQTDNLSSTYIMLLFWDRASRGRTLEEGWPPTNYERQDYYLFPFWHHSRRTLEGRRGADTQLQLWPLFHADAEARGRRDAAVFSLMPTRNLEFLRPADELYSFLWTLWRYQSDGPRRETRLLFDTTLYRESPEGLRISVPFLYSQRPEANGLSQHQILWGLLGAGTDPDGLAEVSMAGWTLWRR
ncbi:MAG: hypothetical protein P8N09_05870 [Planctomycetota bacterium]|nr:hypothetical protein [Planctomycetota bacterium]